VSPLSGGSTPGIHRSDGCKTTGSSDGAAQIVSLFCYFTSVLLQRIENERKHQNIQIKKNIIRLTAKCLDEYQRILLPEEF
jgi:hypothetical protein